MRMHFRPSLGSDARAGAVLGAIFDAALESRYRPHLRPSRSGFLVLGVPLHYRRVRAAARTRHAARCGASARLSSGCERDQVEVPVLVWARENRNRPLRPTRPGAVATGTDGSNSSHSCGYARSNSGQPSPGAELPAVVGAGRAPAGCHVQALTIDLGRERRPTKTIDGSPHQPRRHFERQRLAAGQPGVLEIAPARTLSRGRRGPRTLWRR